jgi:hypothetical protein
VFENRVLRRMFGPKRDKVTGGWRKLYNEELHQITYYWHDHIKEMRWMGQVTRIEEMKNATTV